MNRHLPPTELDLLLKIVEGDTDSPAHLDAALAAMVEASGGVLAAAMDGEGQTRWVQRAGTEQVDPRDLLRTLRGGGAGRVGVVPPAGLAALEVHRMPADCGWLVVGWHDEPSEAGVGWVRAACALIGERLARLRLERRLRERAIVRVVDPPTAVETDALRDASVRRRRAQDLNDDVVQGLTAAILAMQQGEPRLATGYLEQTLTAARRIMTDWFAHPDGSSLRPGALVRDLASVLPPARPADDSDAEQTAVPAPRILVVDDSDDVRTLLCAQLEASGKGTVVGQAANGFEAVRLAAALKPDLVFLDLSMPDMDGLEALPQILALVPGVKVVVMSGFDERSVASQVLACGAARYLEKGLRMNLAAVIDEVYQAA